PSTPSTPSTHETPLQESQSRQATAVTYRELNKKSNRLARHLQSKGVKPGTIVAIIAERSIEMIIGLLGILKAGSAYLPIEPDCPEERINYMLKDSNAKIVLVIDKSENSISKSETNPKDFTPVSVGYNSNDQNQENGTLVLNLEHLNFELVSACEYSASNLPLKASEIAYILYTSGTTGVPKAVIVEHRSVVRLVADTDYIDFSRYDRLLQTGALSFDASTFEIWGALKNGLTLYQEKKETILSANNMKKIVNRYGINVLWMTSALFNNHLQEDIWLFKGIKHLLVGGDVVSPIHVNRLRQEYPAIKVTNGYGPTENTTFSTSLSVEREYSDKIPIGKPI
ncbi:MAG: AMP-binding protein, partial [bacterium]|nr:AMP-binding protein [bacterium]